MSPRIVAWHKLAIARPILCTLLAACVGSSLEEGSGSNEPPPQTEPCWGWIAPKAEAETLEEELCNAILEARLSAFDEDFARYLSGEAPAYRGAVVGHDNRVGNPQAQGEMSGAGFAVLHPANGEAGWDLDVTVPVQGLHMTVSQRDARPDALELGAVLDRWTFGGPGTATPANGLRLSPAPASLELSLSVSGPSEFAGTFTAMLDATLERAEPTSITPFEAFQLVPDRSLLDFVERDGELVRTLEDTWTSDAEFPAGHDFVECARYTPYSYEQFVSTHTIAEHGVRNVILGDSQVCCTDLPCAPMGDWHDWQGCPPLDQCFAD